mmetsp:Transcript_358/g.1045  ORF Transcript_358/g.1045 Transcript_358/m.1045 type:complete len:232 (+) Transcript_358:80-775(+)
MTTTSSRCSRSSTRTTRSCCPYALCPTHFRRFARSRPRRPHRSPPPRLCRSRPPLRRCRGRRGPLCSSVPRASRKPPSCLRIPGLRKIRSLRSRPLRRRRRAAGERYSSLRANNCHRLRRKRIRKRQPRCLPAPAPPPNQRPRARPRDRRSCPRQGMSSGSPLTSPRWSSVTRSKNKRASASCRTTLPSRPCCSRARMQPSGTCSGSPCRSSRRRRRGAYLVGALEKGLVQ